MTTSSDRSRLKYIWLIFAFIFFVLACYHFRIASMQIGHFKNKGQIKTWNGIPLGVADTVNDLNKYVDQVNQSNKDSNHLASGGYIAAMLTAIFSFILDFIQAHPEKDLPASEAIKNMILFPIEWFKRRRKKPAGGIDPVDSQSDTSLTPSTKESEILGNKEPPE